MADSTSQSQPRQDFNLNLASLHSVLLIQSQPKVQDAYAYSQTKLTSAKDYRLIAFVAAIVEFQLVWTWTLLHSVPWPRSVIRGVHYVDEKVEGALLVTFDKTEWYFDYVTIRGMRLVESVLEFCMRGVAFVDSVVTLVVSKWEQRKEFAWVLDYAKQIYEYTTSTISSVWQIVKETLDKLDQVWRSDSADKVIPKKEE